jgi:hypothetical protein
MTITRNNLKGGVAALLLTLLALSGCGSSDSFNAGSPPAAAAVPDSASGSGSAFIAFIASLSQSDETSEPLVFSAAFTDPPEDNTGEPAPVM